MKIMFQKLFKKIGVKSDRTSKIRRHVLISFLYKGGSILSVFLIVPLTINFLNTDNYGIWLIISSFISWFSFFDIGLGHGLRNKFTEAVTNGDTNLAKGYVSSAYFTLAFLSVILIVVFISFNLFIDWTKVFNTIQPIKKELSILMPIIFSFFCIQLVLKLITTIYTANQHHSMQGKVTFFTNLGSLLIIWMLTLLSKSSLLIFGIIFSGFPLIILIALNIFAFNSEFKEYKPSFKFWKKTYLNDIFGLGINFFVIQFSGILLFSTDNLIITQLFDPSSVVPYGISFKYFSIIHMLMVIIVTPYWSSITEANAVSDYEWIKKSMRNLTKISYIFIFGIIVLLFLAPNFYELWIGNKVVIPFELSLCMAIYFSIIIISQPYTYYLNGVGKVKLQMLSLSITALLNIPISYLFSIVFNLNTAGVIIATSVCLIPHLIISPIQYSKLINKRAYGLWNK